MADDTGDGNTQNSQSGDQPYKSFATEDELTSFQSKTFSSGYNDMKSKAIAKLSDAIGEDVSDLDTALDKVKSYKQKLADAVSDPTTTEEYKRLQGTVNEYKQKLSDAEQSAQSIKNQYKIDSMFLTAASRLEESNTFKIPKGDVKDLFLTKHKVEFKDGKEVVRKGDQLLMDDAGNHKSLEKAFIDFAKPYTEPATGGSGGGSGDGTAVAPKFSDFQKATEAGDEKEAERLMKQFVEAGEKWA